MDPDQKAAVYRKQMLKQAGGAPDGTKTTPTKERRRAALPPALQHMLNELDWG